MIDVVIPARNEQNTIGWVVQAFVAHPEIGLIIVSVDRDTEDFTWDMADKAGADWIVTGTHSRGKGQCVQAGLRHVTTERVIFCDADITGLTGEHITHLCYPTDGMILGVPDWPSQEEFEATGQPRKWIRRLAFAWAMVTGQRSLPAEFARSIDLHGYLMETQLNMQAIKNGLDIIPCELQGLHSPFQLTDKRLAEMEHDRNWGINNGWLPQQDR